MFCDINVSKLCDCKGYFIKNRFLYLFIEPFLRSFEFILDLRFGNDMEAFLVSTPVVFLAHPYKID